MVKHKKIKAENDKASRIIEASATAETILIENKARQEARIIEANATGEAMKIEGKARQQAADSISQNVFAQQLALLQEKVKFGLGLQAKTLVISEGNSVAKNIVPMFNLEK